MATLTFREFFNALAQLEGIKLDNVAAFDYFKKQEQETDLLFDNEDDHSLTSDEMYELYISDEPVEMTVRPTSQDYELIFTTDDNRSLTMVVMEVDELFNQLGITIPA